MQPTMSSLSGRRKASYHPATSHVACNLSENKRERSQAVGKGVTKLLCFSIRNNTQSIRYIVYEVFQSLNKKKHLFTQSLTPSECVDLDQETSSNLISLRFYPIVLPSCVSEARMAKVAVNSFSSCSRILHTQSYACLPICLPAYLPICFFLFQFCLLSTRHAYLPHLKRSNPTRQTNRYHLPFRTKPKVDNSEKSEPKSLVPEPHVPFPVPSPLATPVLPDKPSHFLSQLPRHTPWSTDDDSHALGRVGSERLVDNGAERRSTCFDIQDFAEWCIVFVFERQSRWR